MLGDAPISQRKHHHLRIVREQMQVHALCRVRAAGKYGAHEPGRKIGEGISLAARACLRRLVSSLSRFAP